MHATEITLLELGLFGMLCIIIGYSGAIVLTNLHPSYQKMGQSTINDSDKCNFGNVLIDSQCLNDELNEFWFYNSSNTGKELDISQIKDIGGVCTHATQYYVKRFKDLGYEERELGKQIYVNDTNKNNFITSASFRTSNHTAHIVAISSGSYIEDNKTKFAYCVLDQRDIKCTKLE